MIIIGSYYNEMAVDQKGVNSEYDWKIKTIDNSVGIEIIRGNSNLD